MPFLKWKKLGVYFFAMKKLISLLILLIFILQDSVIISGLRSEDALRPAASQISAKTSSAGSAVLVDQVISQIRSLLKQAADDYRARQYFDAQKKLIQAHELAVRFPHSQRVNELLVPTLLRNYYSLISHYSKKEKDLTRLRRSLSGIARRYSHDALAQMLLSAIDFRLGRRDKAELEARRVLRIQKQNLAWVDSELLDKANSILSLINSTLGPRKSFNQHMLLKELLSYSLSDSIRRVLDDFGWSPIDLIRKSRLPDSTVRRLLRPDTKTAQEDTLEIIAKAFGHGITSRHLRTPRYWAVKPYLPKSSSAGNSKRELSGELERLKRYRDYIPGVVVDVSEELKGKTSMPLYFDIRMEKRIRKLERVLGIGIEFMHVDLVRALKSKDVEQAIIQWLGRYSALATSSMLGKCLNAALDSLAQRQKKRVLPLLFRVFTSNMDLDQIREASRTSLGNSGSKVVVVGVKGNVDFYPDLKARDSVLSPGGEAFNAARVLCNLKAEPSVFGFLGRGGNVGTTFKGLLHKEGVPTVDLQATEGEHALYCSAKDGEPEPGSRTLGPKVARHEQERLRQRALGRITRDSHMLVAGWLLPGMNYKFHVDLLDGARRKGAVTYFNTKDMKLLRRLVNASPPEVVLMNLDELCSLSRKTPQEGLSKLEAAVSYGSRILKKGVKVLIVSMGRDGAVLITEDRIYRATAPDIKYVSTIGAGDTLIGAFVYMRSRGKSLEESFKFSIAAASATILEEGTGVCRSIDDANSFLPSIRIIEYLECDILGLRKVSDIRKAVQRIDAAA